MRASARHLVVVGLTALTLGCGGDDDDPTGPQAPRNAPMAAVIDGTPWAAVSASASRSASDVIAFGGTAADLTTISMALAATGPGTYAIPLAGLNFNVSNASSGEVWQALGMGQLGAVGSGSVTFTTLTSTRIAGTFTFQAPGAGTTAGEKVVTQGSFDIPVGSN